LLIFLLTNLHASFFNLEKYSLLVNFFLKKVFRRPFFLLVCECHEVL
jgi:hypothetical protein